ncbi:adenosylcobyric acid synthase (glutamine-hydrolysing) [Candidatus Electrothrix aarhusensis]|uniref:Cobyric acid synthase n=1 Tax=Candidatus Electrothrix aarhusensis TaxID=1859131 RepID=A0A444J371_9BACT|nr:adenosylcobyric acid synthase (glutamine-hydrolysing) [Candidatus Electrothrix aarhusensis]
MSEQSTSGGHGGNIKEIAARRGCPPEDILDFSANINPIGPPNALWNVLAARMQDIVHYPDPESAKLVQALAGQYQIPAEQILPGNGTSDLLYATLRALRTVGANPCVRPCTSDRHRDLPLQPIERLRRAVIPVPAYIDYRQACERANIEVVPLPLSPNDDFQPNLAMIAAQLQAGDLVILGQPNNPTGRMNDREALLALADQHPEVLFLLDEAFAGFVTGYTSLAGCRENIITLCSLTKLFAVPGLRLGFLAASEELCCKIKQQLAPWSVNTLAQAAGKAMIGDTDYISKTQEVVQQNREILCRALAAIPALQIVPGAADFLLIRLDSKITAAELADQLLQQAKIAIRVCANYEGLDERYFRVAVRSEEENNRLVAALKNILLPRQETGSFVGCGSRIKKTPSLMFLGTGSDVGKSVLVAGLCRVLLQDGVRVAPFKAQNMSLNSYVTRDGGEMGRAQVVQAQACRLDPDVRMNPVLLKPSSDVGSQVIVQGKPIGNMRVLDYVRYKEQAWQEVCRSYDELAADFDCIILEGAGSPGEVNLKSHDIVNMRMAQYSQSPALLVGDIDRGGVYASFIGHVEVMAPWERKLLAGFLVNRFRGDASLLADAHDFVEQRTGKPVFGVIPWLNNLGLPQEDSVSFKAGLYDSAEPAGEHVEIVLIDLPHISNFTDLEPLLEEKDVWLRTVRRVDELGTPDGVILPGSKNVVADLAWLSQTGLDRAICGLAEQGCQITGICGGFQILGKTVADPHGIEGEAGSLLHGLGLLNLTTELAADKTLIRREGKHLPSGQPVHGYEIHHGQTGSSKSGGTGSGTVSESLLTFADGASCGSADRTGRVWGSYLHGIFDSDPFRRWFINTLREAKGLPPFSGQGAQYDLEPALDRLAAVVRQEIDMDAVYRLLKI